MKGPKCQFDKLSNEKKLFYQCREPNEILCYTNPNLKFP